MNGDADRLQQVVWNLLSNAVKFTEPAAAVRLAYRAVDGASGAERRGHRPGNRAEFLPYVFDRFRQADASASRRHGGLGLGLALVRQIVELHGGEVCAESAGHLRGATFSVDFPSARVGFVLRRLAQQEPVTLNGVSVLIVDDNDDGRELLVTALKEYGARIRDVKSADAALVAIGEPDYRVDVLVSDLGMPDADGYDLIRRIRTACAQRSGRCRPLLSRPTPIPRIASARSSPVSRVTSQSRWIRQSSRRRLPRSSLVHPSERPAPELFVRQKSSRLS